MHIFGTNSFPLCCSGTGQKWFLWGEFAVKEESQGALKWSLKLPHNHYAITELSPHAAPSELVIMEGLFLFIYFFLSWDLSPPFLESCMFCVLNIPGESSDRFPMNHSPSLRWIIYNGYWCLHKEGATEALWRKAYILFITFGRRWTLLSPVIATVVWHHLCSQELGNWFSCRIIWMKTTLRWIQMSFVTESCLPWQSALNCSKFVRESDKLCSL